MHDQFTFPPATHRTDPAPSRIAEHRITATGQRRTHCDKVLSVVKRSPRMTAIELLPLLGLLGTVTGMVQVFDVMAIAGTSNARLMAGGVSAATIPTMAGLVAALSGVYLVTFLENKANAEIERAEDLLLHH